MAKKTLATLFLIIIVFALSACTKSEQSPLPDDSNIASEDQVSSLSTEDDASIEEGGQDWEALYAPTLKMYWDVYTGNLDPKSVDIIDSLGNKIIIDRGIEHCAFQYSYYDINGDSIPELLVAPTSEVGGLTADIYSINTVDNTLVPVHFTSYHRIIYGNMYLANADANKAYVVLIGGDEGYAIADIYEITSAIPKAVMIDSIRIAPDWENDTREYYRGLEGKTFMEVEKDQGEVISEDEFYDFASKYGIESRNYSEYPPNRIDIDWKILYSPDGAAVAIKPNVQGGIYIRSEPVVSGDAGQMADGNKIGYIPAGRTDVVLTATRNTAIDEEGYYLWYEVEIPQSYRDSAEQSTHYSGKPLVGWVREDVVMPVSVGQNQSTATNIIYFIPNTTSTTEREAIMNSCPDTEEYQWYHDNNGTYVYGKGEIGSYYMRVVTPDGQAWLAGSDVNYNFLPDF